LKQSGNGDISKFHAMYWKMEINNTKHGWEGNQLLKLGVEIKGNCHTNVLGYENCGLTMS